MGQMNFSRSRMIRTLPVVVAWLIAGLSIESAAADSEESWTQRWTRALDDVRGTDSARRQASWPSIREIAVYCPRHPELIEAMFSVLSDDGRRDDWDMALTWINQALHAGASLSKRQVELLTEKLAQMNQPQLDSGIVTLAIVA